MQRGKYPRLAAKYKGVNGTPIFREEIEIVLSKHGNGPIAKVIQFPLRINYASTAHKMQVNT